MRAEVGPPERGFQFVMEYVGPLDPKIPKIVVCYAEPTRQTRRVQLLGKDRPLVFLSHKTSRDRQNRLGWRDRTSVFKAEWTRLEDGTWARTPPPIMAPDPDPAVAAVEDPLEQPVKILRRRLNAGEYDDLVVLRGMLDRERSKDEPRMGAITMLVGRISRLPEPTAAAAG